jgi:hypothetical protein
MANDAERLETKEWLDTFDVSNRYGVPAESVRYWRHISYGPVPIKLGRHVRYRASDWDDFTDELQRQARAQQGADGPNAA